MDEGLFIARVKGLNRYALVKHERLIYLQIKPT